MCMCEFMGARARMRAYVGTYDRCREFTCVKWG